jgi:hypothetical protein
MLTDTTHHVWPHSHGKTAAPRIMKFTLLLEVFLLYIIMHVVKIFLTFMQF